ncbi:hypothetical protein LR48_Vigan02g201700 [Vigna angularis]|uniref:Uncharacterized protein n=1 Tax=Phaseolus angularis TaxID=3914 RepID=A0A0L9TZL6_PHAAN|nr:hypothetical protein LR48_Vigan02g201700 [Vigna angularis]
MNLRFSGRVPLGGSQPNTFCCCTSGGAVTVKACLSLADLVAYTSGGGRCRCFLAPQCRRKQSKKEFDALGVNKTEREDKSVEVSSSVEMEVRQSSSGTSRCTWRDQRVMWRLPNDYDPVVVAGAEAVGRGTICQPYLRIRCSFDDAGAKGSSNESVFRERATIEPCRDMMEVRQSSSGTSRATWRDQRVMWSLPNDKAPVVAAGAEGLAVGAGRYAGRICVSDVASTTPAQRTHPMSGCFVNVARIEPCREQGDFGVRMTPREREKRAEEVAEHLVESDTTNKLFCYCDQRQVDLSEIPERVEAANSGFYLSEPCGVSAGMNGGCRRCEASRVSAVTGSFNNKADGIQDFRNSTIIVYGGCTWNSVLNLQVQHPMLEWLQRFLPLVRASISLAIRIGETYMIGLGRAARVVVSGRPSLPLSAADAKDIYSLTPGNIYVNRHSYFVKMTQNKQNSSTFVRHFSPHADWFIPLSELNYSLGIEVYYFL